MNPHRQTYLILFLILTLSFTQHANSQSLAQEYYKVKLTNIDFSIGDTVIPYSLLVEPTGEIDLEEGHNFSYKKINMTSFRFVGKGKNTKTLKDTIIPDDKTPVELTSYFPPLNQDSTKFINGYGLEFTWSPHYEYEILGSYILKGISAENLYKSNSDSIVRIIVPEEGIDHEIYNIYQIDFGKDPIEIRYIKTQHDLDGNFKILEEGTSIVRKEKDEIMLLKELEELNLTEDSYFLKVDGAIQYMIEFKTRKTYFAGMRHYRNKDGIIPENAFPWTVRFIYEKNKKRK